MAQRARKLATAWKEWLSAEGGRLFLYARQRTSSVQDAEDRYNRLHELWNMAVGHLTDLD